MKKIVLALLASVAFLSVAQATDVLPTPTQGATLASRWSGLYAGANVGYDFGNSGFNGVSGVSGGLLAGYNFQPAPWIVVGLEADAGYANGYLGTLRGRLGVPVMPALLVYGTGGFAFGTPTLTQVHPFTNVSTGWSAGAGAEYALTSNLSLRAEWLYYDLGPVTGNLARTGVAYKF